MTMPVIAIIAATICQIQCKETEENLDASRTPDQTTPDCVNIAKYFLKPNFFYYIIPTA